MHGILDSHDNVCVRVFCLFGVFFPGTIDKNQ